MIGHYHDGQAEHHLVGMEERNSEEDDEAGQEVVTLVVHQVVDQAVKPAVRVLDIRDLEPGNK